MDITDKIETTVRIAQERQWELVKRLKKELDPLLSMDRCIVLQTLMSFYSYGMPATAARYPEHETF